MSDANTRGCAEPSPASAGSHGPVAWTVGYGGGGGYFTDDERKAASWRDAGATVAPLYRQPQPTLTDEEREAIEWAINKTARTYDDHEGGPMKREALRGLLERTK